MISHLFFYRRLALAGLIFSIGVLFVTLTLATEAAPPTPEKDESKLKLEPVEAELAYQDMSESGLYIVQLHDAPLASYRGGTRGLRATNPAVKGDKKLDVRAPESVAYLEYLEQQRAAAIVEVSRALDRQLSVTYEYKASLNGFAAEMTAAEAATVAKLPTIKHIEADTVHELQTDAGPTWIGAPAIWGQDPNIKLFETQLSGDNEVPAVITDTRGSGMFTYNMTTGELHYTIEHNAANVTAMHIHTGTAGVNGGVAFPLDHATGTGTVTLTTDSQRHALINGGYYVNVHTSAFPNGELRGQITAQHFFNAVPFEAELSGTGEVPPVTDTQASGVGTFTFDAETGDLDYMIDVSDIMSITAAHIHSGTVSQNGDILHTLYDGTGEFDPDHPISGTVTLSDTQLAALWSGGLYINIHTTDNPGGELRDQIEQIGTLGEGIIVGVIDTGIDPWNPSFADVGDDGYDHTNPSGAGNYVGVCDPDNTGENGAVAYDPTFPCNDKLIGTWGYATVQDGDPRDSNGHGSHTGSTAAGNVVLNATIETPTQPFTVTQISGVAPHANVIAYAACCTGSALAAARDQVVLDGVDVVNYSIGSTGPTGHPWGDAEAVQWLNIRDAGIFVATSAGNAGPSDETVGSPADIPWITSVGANSHNRAFLNSVTLDDGTNPPVTIDGLGMTGPLDTPTEVVFAADYVIPPATADEARLCAADAFPAGTFTGQIVLCERGGYGRVAKGQAVADGGAGGYILAQPDEFGGGPGAVGADPHVIPSVHIDYYSYQDLLAYFNNAPGAVEGTISGATLDVDNAHGDVMGSFSSRGANRALADIIVPSVTAPGRSILAAYHQGEGGDGDFTFDVIGGTSMASPHVAGSAALMMASHPDWTPAEIQSALMTTARDSILNDDGITPATPFAQGAGEVDLTQAPLAGLVLDVTTQEFLAANPAEGGDPKALNLSSLGNSQCFASCSWTRTVRSTLGVTQTWNATIMADSGVTLTATVEPATFELAPGATQELTVTVDVTQLPTNQWFFADLMLTPSPPVRSAVAGEEVPDAHLPIAVRPLISILPSKIEVDTRRNAGSQLIEGIQAIEISELTINTSLSQGTLTHEMLAQDSDMSTPYDDLSDGVFFITTTVPADAYSLLAETTESSATALNLFVGLDTNGDGMPQAGEQLCSSTTFTFTVIRVCELVAPAEGTYWILVQNWFASASPPDVVTLVSAVVPNSDNNYISVAAPDSVPSGEVFDMRLFWDIPEMLAGERWYGYVSLGTDGANRGNLGTIPLYLKRHEDDVTKEVSHAQVEAGDTVTYTIAIQPDVTNEKLTYSLTDTIPAGMTYVADSATASQGSASVTGDILTWTGGPPTIPTLVESNITGYINLAALGVGPAPCPTDCDDGGHLITGLDITYQGQHYTQAIWSVNGTLELGTASGVTSGGLNQELPNSDTPNNLLAPWWSDLDLSAGGNWYFVQGTLWGNAYAVFEWQDVPLKNDPTSTATFQIWLLDGSDQIWFTYDEITGDTSTATVGVENDDGTFGHSYYYNGSGTLPSSAHDLLIIERKDPVVITFGATADQDAVGEVTNTVSHNTDNPGSRVESASASTEVENDGIDGQTEDGAPNAGDGNGDGIADSQQGNVASLPNQGDEDGYVTWHAPEDLSLVTVSASPPPMTLPIGVDAMPQGLFDFTVVGLNPGDTVTVTLYLHTSQSELDSYWKYDQNTESWTDATSLATFGTAVISGTTVSTVMLELTDGGIGDLDGTPNGTIVDPGGPARAAPTAISLATFERDGKAEPFALLALFLLLVAASGLAILKKLRTV